MRTLVRVVAVATTLILATATTVAARPMPEDPAPRYQPTYLRQNNSMNSIVLRWNPCRAHTYKVNLAAVPPKSRPAVLAETKAAVQTLAAGTGMSFTYRGQTGEVPQLGSDKQTADVIIAYTTPAKTNYPLNGPTVGLVGPIVTCPWRRAGGRNYTTAIKSAVLVIDTPQMLRLKPGFTAGMSRGNVLLHELGHVVGLRHVAYPHLLMHVEMTARTPNGYTAGDLAGLAKVGRKAGCLNGF